MFPENPYLQSNRLPPDRVRHKLIFRRRRLVRTLRFIIICMAALSCASCGPRMRLQPSILPYERKMPTMPSGTVPTSGSLTAISNRAAQTGPPAGGFTDKDRKNGKIFYGYYCLMCHGSDGRGNGPVGQSYVPKPADLTSPAVSGLPDGEIYRRMLAGTGHSPVLAQTVPPNQRWPIVTYVRTFKGRPESEREPARREAGPTNPALPTPTEAE